MHRGALSGRKCSGLGPVRGASDGQGRGGTCDVTVHESRITSRWRRIGRRSDFVDASVDRPKRATLRPSEHPCRRGRRLATASLRAYNRQSLCFHGAFHFPGADLRNRRTSRVGSGLLCPGTRGCRREAVTTLATPPPHHSSPVLPAEVLRRRGRSVGPVEPGRWTRSRRC
jgi:hypothetical protein